MCVSTGNVGVLHLPMLPLAHQDVMPESAARQDRREGRESEKREAKRKDNDLLALIEEKSKSEIH